MDVLRVTQAEALCDVEGADQQVWVDPAWHARTLEGQTAKSLFRGRVIRRLPLDSS